MPGNVCTTSKIVHECLLTLEEIARHSSLTLYGFIGTLVIFVRLMLVERLVLPWTRLKLGKENHLYGYQKELASYG